MTEATFENAEAVVTGVECNRDNGDTFGAFSSCISDCCCNGSVTDGDAELDGPIVAVADTVDTVVEVTATFVLLIVFNSMLKCSLLSPLSPLSIMLLLLLLLLLLFTLLVISSFSSVISSSTPISDGR